MTTQVLEIPKAPTSRPSRRGFGAGSISLPALIILGIFFVYPLALIFWLSFTGPQFGFDNYIALLTDGVSITVLIRTLAVGFVVSVTTLILAYPYAYSMTVSGPAMRTLLLTVVLLPFWMNVIARTFAWFILMARGGPIDEFFSFLGLKGFVLLNTWGGVTVAMVQVMLPFMVLPLYNRMRTIDPGLMRAAASLGARPTTSFLRVYLPLSLPGIVSGVSLVFVVTLGFYITPALLGSPDQALLSQVIATKVRRLLDFPGAGATAVTLLVVVLIILALFSIIVRRWMPKAQRR